MFGSVSIPVFVWAAAFVVFLIIEGLAPGLVSIWFAAGALAALLCAVFHGPLWLQIVLFIVVSAIALIVTRPLARRFVNSRKQATNADRCIGREVLVTEAICELENTGTVRLDGVEWSARSVSGEDLAKGTKVIVRELRGNKLIVEPV